MKILTKEDLQVIKRFQKFFLKQTCKKLLKMIWVPILAAVVCFLMGMYLTGIYIISFYIIYIIIYPPLFNRANKKLNKSNPSASEAKIIEFSFDESNFTVKAYREEKLISTNVFKYENIFKIDEAKDTFYIYVASNQALCVLKEDIEILEVNELRGILQSKVSKYNEIKW